MPRHQVLLLPGGVLPAAPAYIALLAALGGEVGARVKDLEVYATPVPPSGYSMAVEVAGIERLAAGLASIASTSSAIQAAARRAWPSRRSIPSAS